jgi:hypothetical protein
MFTDERAIGTEWADAEICLITHGKEHKLEIRMRDDVGCLMHYSVAIEERDARYLRAILPEAT